tara:strand:- start:388 stop:489 length:102 start_codon:yes stop_codon:yes gene_type:complete
VIEQKHGLSLISRINDGRFIFSDSIEQDYSFFD